MDNRCEVVVFGAALLYADKTSDSETFGSFITPSRTVINSESITGWCSAAANVLIGTNVLVGTKVYIVCFSGISQCKARLYSDWLLRFAAACR